jgi:hypothetical protein
MYSASGFIYCGRNVFKPDKKDFTVGARGDDMRADKQQEQFVRPKSAKRKLTGRFDPLFHGFLEHAEDDKTLTVVAEEKDVAAVIAKFLEVEFQNIAEFLIDTQQFQNPFVQLKQPGRADKKFGSPSIVGVEQ